MRTGIPEIENARRVHFTGVGGIGMSALAQLLRAEGLAVTGSDRAYDQGRDLWIYEKLMAQGIAVGGQDGQQLGTPPDCLVVTRAVEGTNPELVAARGQGVPTVMRPDLLAGIVNNHSSVGVTGSCGKSTTTAMIGQILEHEGMDPTVILGAIAARYETPTSLGNLRMGGGELVVAEVDESDGSVSRFHPEVAVITMVSKDHFEPEELKRYLRPFLSRTERVILNQDCLKCRSFTAEFGDRVVTCGIDAEIEATSIELGRTNSRFEVSGAGFVLPVPGLHNISNALCAVGAARFYGVPDETTRQALAEYGGLYRRWNLVGTTGDVDVVDDFAHSPSKIARALMTAHQGHRRVHAVYQPHGYRPTRFLWDEYLQTFATGLNSPDCLYLLDIYDAGGTTDRSVTSDDFAAAIREEYPLVTRPRDRADLVDRLCQDVAPGDLVLVMGARDYSLADLARSIAGALAVRVAPVGAKPHKA